MIKLIKKKKIKWLIHIKKIITVKFKYSKK